MTTPTTFAINGVPVENYGLRVTNASGFLDLPARTYSAVQPVQRDGQVAVSQAGYTAPRMMKLQFYVQPSSLNDRRVKLNALRAALRGLLAVTTVEDATKAVYGLLSTGATAAANRWFLAPEVTEEIGIICHDPLWYDTSPQTLSMPATNTDYVIPMGSALLRRMRLVINGSWSGTITATMKNNGGATVQTMSSTWSAAGGESLEIECDPAKPHLRSYSSGVSTDRVSTLGTMETFFVAEPMDAPTLRVDKGTGATLYVYRAYEA